MQKWIPGLLLSAFLCAPAYAQLGMPSTIPMQGDGPLNRARQMQRDAEQLNQNSRKGETPPSSSTPAKATPKASTTPSKSTTYSTSARDKKISTVDKEALQAAKGGLENTYREKLELGANPGATDESGASALHLAAYKGHNGIIEQVLAQKGVLLDARDGRGMTPLMLAAGEGRDETLSLLLKAGADLKIKTSEGTTALHLAAAKGNATTVSLLLKAGADPSALDNKSQSAAVLAEKKKKGNWEEVLRILKNAPP